MQRHAEGGHERASQRQQEERRAGNEQKGRHREPLWLILYITDLGEQRAADNRQKQRNQHEEADKRAEQ